MHLPNPYMEAAFTEAEAAFARDEVPVGAIIVHQGQIIARAGNRTEADCDPTAHAELLAIREACRLLGDVRLPECDLYVTLEPCPMCAQAISFARIRRLYFAAPDPKMGGVEHGVRIFGQTSCYVPEVYSGIGEERAVRLLRRFFQEKR